MKKKTVASVSSHGGVTIGSSDVIRWDDAMEVQGHAIKISKAVELGEKYESTKELAGKLTYDLKSETGLLITFPIAILMDRLQREVGTGERLLELVQA